MKDGRRHVQNRSSVEVDTLPDRFAPLDAEGDDLYGVWTDELDVQYVVRVRIDRPAE